MLKKGGGVSFWEALLPPSIQAVSLLSCNRTHHSSLHSSSSPREAISLLIALATHRGTQTPSSPSQHQRLFCLCVPTGGMKASPEGKCCLACFSPSAGLAAEGQVATQFKVVRGDPAMVEVPHQPTVQLGILIQEVETP